MGSKFPFTRAQRRQILRKTGVDAKEVWERGQVETSRQLADTLARTCGWCGQAIGNPQFHPPPDYDCAKLPLIKSPLIRRRA